MIYSALVSFKYPHLPKWIVLRSHKILFFISQYTFIFIYLNTLNTVLHQQHHIWLLGYLAYGKVWFVSDIIVIVIMIMIMQASQDKCEQIWPEWDLLFWPVSVLCFVFWWITGSLFGSGSFVFSGSLDHMLMQCSLQHR